MKHKKIYFALLSLVALVLAALACGSSVEEAIQATEPTSPPAEQAAPTQEENASQPTDTPSEEATTPEEATPEPEEAAPEPQNPLVAINLPSGMYYYSNVNQLRNLTLFEDKLWGAGTGGVVSWDLTTGEYRKYTPLDGLLHGGTFAIQVCNLPEPTLLVGTHEGLAVYDPASDSFASGVDIYDLQDRIFHIRCNDTYLVFEGDRDLDVVNLATGEITNYDDDVLAWIVTEDVVLNGDEIWLPSGYSGVTHIKDGEATIYSVENGNLPFDDVATVAIAPNGDVWMSGGDGLFKFDPNGTPTLYNKDNVEGFPFFSADTMAFAPDGSLWLGFHSEVCQFDIASASCVALFDGEPGMAEGGIWHLIVDESGRVFYNVFGEGMSMYDGSTWTRYFVEGELPSSAAWGLLQGPDDNIWIRGDGIYRTDLETTQWTVFGGGSDMVADPDGSLWKVGGTFLAHILGEELTQWDKDDGMYDAQALALELDSQGRVWIGYDNAVSVFDGSSFTVYTLEADGWPESYIHDMLADGDAIWVATDAGLIRIDTTTSTWEHVLNEENMDPTIELLQLNFWKLALDTDGTLLIASAVGLLRYDYVEHAIGNAYGAECVVSDFYVVGDGTLWVACGSLLGSFFGGSADSGVYHFDGNEWSFYGLGDGLPVSEISAILVDNAGTVWLAGGDRANGGGILRIVP